MQLVMDIENQVIAVKATLDEALNHIEPYSILIDTETRTIYHYNNEYVLYNKQEF